MLRAPLSPLTKYLYFPATAALACVEKLAAVANTVAVERDWVGLSLPCSQTSSPHCDRSLMRMGPLVDHYIGEPGRAKARYVYLHTCIYAHFTWANSASDLNASIRRIDLFCKLVAPVFISIIDAYSTFTAILTVVSLTTISVVIEYFAIARVCDSNMCSVIDPDMFYLGVLPGPRIVPFQR